MWWWQIFSATKTKYNTQIQEIQCDNAGENHAFEVLYKKERNGVAFKYAVPGTPQQNSCVEKKIKAIWPSEINVEWR